MIKNKEVVDALCLLLHCSLKDKKYETQKQQFDLIYNYIEKIERQNEIKDAYLDIIYDIGVDYDGCNTIKSLKELIDEYKFKIQISDSPYWLVRHFYITIMIAFIILMGVLNGDQFIYFQF